MTQTVAGLTVETLIANGIDNLYCLPGVQNDPFFDALYDRSDALAPIHTRHEQGAAYMALGAALATGEPQAFCVVPGPGLLNTAAALSTAYATNAPVLALVSEIHSDAIGQGLGALHEIPDQLGVLQRLTRQAERVTDGATAHAVLQSAFTALRSGRRGPVGVEVPTDVWNATVESSRGDLVAPARPGPAPDPAAVAEAAELIAAAERPMIVVGGGAQPFSSEICQLAEQLSAPVLAFRMGRGVMPSDYPLSITTPTGYQLWPHTDVVIGLGTRLAMAQSTWGVDDDLTIIHIDIDADEIGRAGPPAVGIHADLADALPLLADAMGESSLDRSAWRSTVADTRAEAETACAAALAPQYGWLGAIRAELPAEGIFVDEMTQCGYVSWLGFEVFRPRTFISAGYQGTLGYGFATALGAAHARRDVPVVSIVGDGGALFTINELATAVRHNIPLTTIVFNDHAYGNVRRIQHERYGGRVIASDLTSPDFVKLADSFGVRALRASTPDELRTRLRETLGSGEPAVVEVPFGEVPFPWPHIVKPRIRGLQPSE
ncbi:thiamine pyrophosphate-dependent enzyme [Candidatus Poriferisodalis sp.]|uniref:thiamine pyrophosphate-dependent enzyme n=1 Tax=Candidatus Poriferisodalis sp. TaxID=3101277 RepID=UPI003B023A37